jgi:hypothetical protein
MFTEDQLAAAGKALAADPQLPFRLCEDVRRLAASCRDWNTWQEIDNEINVLLGDQARGPMQICRLIEARENFEKRAALKAAADQKADAAARAAAHARTQDLMRGPNWRQREFAEKAAPGTTAVLNTLSDRVSALHQNLARAACEADIRAVLSDFGDSLKSSLASIAIEHRASIDREAAATRALAA